MLEVEEEGESEADIAELVDELPEEALEELNEEQLDDMPEEAIEKVQEKATPAAKIKIFLT